MAIVHTAIYDAVNSIDREYAPYLTMVDVHPRASKEAAVVSAAYETLVAIFPAQKATFDARRNSSLAEIQDGRAETDGINAGKAVATLILAQRATGGSDTTVTDTPRTDKVHFVVPSETSGIADRSFTSFSQAADESGISRIYAGIHFNFDNTAGLQSGKRLGNYVAAGFLKKDAGTATANLINGELFVNGTSRADTMRIHQGAGTLSVTVNHRRLADFSRSQVMNIIVDAGDGNDFV